MKKAQIWSADFAISITLFVLTLGGIFTYIQLTPTTSTNTLQQEANTISEDLLSEGYPENWTAATATQLGVLNNSEISQQKIQRYANLTYPLQKTLHGVAADYVVTIRNTTATLNPPCTLGANITTTNCEPNITAIQPQNLAFIERLTTYNDEPVILTVYAWN